MSFNPDQPRDYHGRWGGGNSSGHASSVPLTLNKHGVAPGFTKHEFIHALKKEGGLKKSYIHQLAHQWGHTQHFSKTNSAAEMSITGPID